MRNKILAVVSVVLVVVILAAGVYFAATSNGFASCNTYKYSLQKADDNTNYSTLKKVEDTCRSMIASYTSDKLVYEQYKDSESAEKRSWGEEAKMRANKTASSYNEYFLKNSFVWKNNIPDDIEEKLEFIE